LVVNGQDARRSFVNGEVDLRVHDALRAPGRPLDAAVHQTALADAVARPKVGDLMVPGEREQPGLVANDRFQNAPPGATDDALLDVGELADDRRLFARA